MAVRSETVTRHTYYTALGSVEMYEETKLVKINAGTYRTHDPELLREFASLLNDIAAKMEDGKNGNTL